MTLNKIGDSTHKNYYKIVGFDKENTYYSSKKKKTIICS